MLVLECGGSFKSRQCQCVVIIKKKYHFMPVCNGLIPAVERIVVDLHVCVKRAGSHCVAKRESACARAYSKLDYTFGLVLLTVTKQLCSWREFEWSAFTVQKI